MVSNTDNFNLRKYSQGESSWDHGDTVDAAETNLVLRDAEGNRGSYTAHADQIYWPTDSNTLYEGDGSSWNSLGTLFQTSDPGTAAIYEELSQDRVVYTTENDFGAINPGGTSTPVMDAVDAINNTGDQMGAIWLPPVQIQETGPLEDMSDISIIGMGIGSNGERGSVVEITGNNPGMSLTSWSDMHHAFLHNFTLYGNGNTNAAIDFDGTSGAPRFNMGVMQFIDWQDTNGVIQWSNSNNAFNSTWGHIIFGQVGSALTCHGPALNFDSGNPLCLRIGALTGHVDSDWYIRAGDNGGKPIAGYIGMINNVGEAQGIFTGDIPHNGSLHLGHVNYEPGISISQGGRSCIEKWGDGPFQVDELIVTGFGGDSITYDAAIELGERGGSGTFSEAIIKSVRTRGTVTLNSDLIELVGGGPTSGNGNESFYFGHSDDVTNTAGTSTNNFRCLATAGTGEG